MHARLKKDDGLLPRSVAGEREATWIVADYLDVVLHVFTPEARDFLPPRRSLGRRAEVESSAVAALALARAPSRVSRRFTGVLPGSPRTRFWPMRIASAWGRPIRSQTFWSRP